MATKILKKAMLKDGTYHSADGEVVVTPERRQKWVDNFFKMKKANAHIPMSWDHGTTEDELLPVVGNSRSAANTVGELINVATTNDGIELTVQITDPKAIERAERNEVYISPVIFPEWKHGNGQHFEDCFTHVDLVNHPVDHSQGPFVTATENTPGHVACCLRMGLSTKVYTPKAILMAKSEGDHYYGDKDFIRNHDGSGGGKARSKKARSGRIKKKKRMSLMSFVRLSNAPSDEELQKLKSAGFVRLGEFGKDDDKEKDGDKETPPPVEGEAVADETSEATKVEELTSGEGDERDSVDDILDLLETFNIVLPEDTTDVNLLDRLRTCLHTAVAINNANEAKNAPAEEDEAEEEADLKVASPMMQTMSLQAKTALAFAENMHRENVAREMKQLLADGKCTPVEFQQHSATLNAVKLSLDTSGKPKPTDVEKWIASRIPVPKGTFWDGSQKLSLSTVEQPSHVDGGAFTQEQAAATAAWAAGGGPKPSFIQ